MFLNDPLVPTGGILLYEYIQSADATGMEAAFTAAIAAIVAANAKPLAPQLNVVDVDIAGGGDGHTFVVRFLLSTAPAALSWTPTVLPKVRGRFWMGSDAEALEAYQEAAIASLRSGTTQIDKIAVGLAGAAKGTRFMAFIAAEAVLPT
jgi:hypothetical protein